MTHESLNDLYMTELRDLYSAENQIVKALPKMIEKSTSIDLRSALQDHLAQTHEHVSRLEEVFEIHGEKAKADTCDGIKGILHEGADTVDDFSDSPALNAAIIGACQRVEHYEMAAYGSARTYAQQLGYGRAASILQETLDEEGEADKILTDIARREANVEAVRTA